MNTFESKNMWAKMSIKISLCKYSKCSEINFIFFSFSKFSATNSWLCLGMHDIFDACSFFSNSTIWFGFYITRWYSCIVYCAIISFIKPRDIYLWWKKRTKNGCGNHVLRGKICNVLFHMYTGFHVQNCTSNCSYESGYCYFETIFFINLLKSGFFPFMSLTVG